MAYKVVLTNNAQKHLRGIIKYISFHFHNGQAARAVLQDAKETRNALVTVADSLKYCDDPELKRLGYKTIHFRHHKYFFVFRTDGSTVFIDGVYHDLQDFENLFKHQI